MKVHPHARERMRERRHRGGSRGCIRDGERFSAKFGRQGFRRNFHFGNTWLGRNFAMKQVEAIGVREDDDWLVISVIVKYF
jgi:hypothetical protein